VQENKYSAWADPRNVRNQYKGMSNEQIKEELKKTKLPCSILCQNIEGDFNMSCIVRTANNFNVSNIYYYGRRRFDRRGCCGCYLYSSLTYIEDIDDVYLLKNQYSFIGFDNNVPGVSSIKGFVYPRNTLFVFGEESIGISNEVFSMLDHIVEIPSRGSVRSLNVAVAAGIALSDYWTKMCEETQSG
jgi:tRNA G18 (ribose-2'-O)-methylase SpoU